ncbi:hypothetical protein HMPREF3156_02286 [Neisseria sp. HMSC06F02]|jgi:hypothetical protein|nr:hypothetical protein HMPREF3156_02286 [Neisseria sp. HMSC06F02]
MKMPARKRGRHFGFMANSNGKYSIIVILAQVGIQKLGFTVVFEYF